MYSMLNVEKFQSTRPVWGGTIINVINRQKLTFQSTRPVWGGTEGVLVALRIPVISIHPPRVGRDDVIRRKDRRASISIHPPRVGRDAAPGFRRAGTRHFNPPAPCGAGQACDLILREKIKFQSTRPVWGGTTAWANSASCLIFQSTRPVWGGTGLIKLARRYGIISIHPPRVGRDSNNTQKQLCVLLHNIQVRCNLAHKRRWR